jgi:hypothetical protein
MPKIRPGWTPRQSIYLRIAAIEYLRVASAEQNCEEYIVTFFEEWLMTYGVPEVLEGCTAEGSLALLKKVRQPSILVRSLFILYTACHRYYQMARLRWRQITQSLLQSSHPRSQTSAATRSLSLVGSSG